MPSITADSNRGAGSIPGQPVVGVVLLSLDQRELTLRCLRSLARVDLPSIRIIIWDNGSVDGTTEAVVKDFPDVIVQRSPQNLGAAAGRNAAAGLAIELFAPSHLLFLDNDTVVTPDLVQRLVEPTLSDPRVSQTAPKIRLLNDPARLDMAGGARIRFWLGETTGIGRGELDRGQFDAPYDCVAGGCTLIRTEAFRAIGGFDPTFDPYGYEDMDLSLRLIETGHRCRYVPRAVLYHAVTQTFESGRYTSRYARIKSRNWFLFLWRHAPWHQRLGFFLVGAPLLLARRIMHGQSSMAGRLVMGAADFLRSAIRRGNRVR